MTFDVVGIGVSPLDFLVLTDHHPNKEEVRRAEDASIQGGGPVATALCTLARLGAKAAMIDVLGDDWAGSAVLDGFREFGVAVEHIKIIEGATSPCALVLISGQDHSRSIIYHPGEVPELTSSDLPGEIIQSARFLHLNGRHWDASLAAIRWARETNVLVSFDGGADRYRPEMNQILSLADVCIVARDFARKASRQSTNNKAAKALRSMGPKLVVITDGPNGSWVHSDSEAPFHQPAFVMKDARDTTGCGDSYHGAFLFGLLNDWPLPKTAKFASAVAALNSRCLGGRRGLPTLEEVHSFLARHSA